ncbi:MAG: histidine phosphatase family protein [Anaerolineae bacterium]
MTTRLILVRHGETDWNLERRYQGQADVPLNERGREQAKLLAKRLRGERIEAIYASDLSRACETAKIIAEALGQGVKTLESLREVDTGVWTGLTFEEVESRYPKHLTEWRADPLGVKRLEGEAYLELFERTRAAIGEIVEAHPDQTVLIVGHGGNIKCIVLDALGVKADRAIEIASRFAAENASLHILQYDGDGGLIQTLNDRCHLDRLPVK